MILRRLGRSLRAALACGLYYTGLIALWQRRVLRGRAVVLMYHRVLTAEELERTGSNPAIAVSVETFELHMAALRRHCNVLSLDTFARHMDGRIPFPDSSVLVTFDDGWSDNFTNALPVLRRYRVPALVFLPSQFVGSQRLFWQESLVHLLLLSREAVARQPATRSRLAALLLPVGLDSALDLPLADARRTLANLVGAQKTLARRELDALILALADEVDVDPLALSPTDGFLGWSQIRAMERDGVAFGGHGVEHLLLTQSSPLEVSREVGGSKSFLEQSFPSTLPTFSYPNGYVDDAAVNAVREAGFRLAFTTSRGMIGCTDDPYMVRRLNVHETVTRTAPLFMARLVGLF